MKRAPAPGRAAPTPELPQSLASAAASVAAAPDRQLTQIVAFLDALPTRGPADALITAARPRLAALRPGRPPSALRSLLEPLSPLLRAGGAFDPADPSLSRPAAVAIARAIITATSPDGVQAPDWQAASAWLATAPPPPGWAAAGRGEDEYPPIRDRICAVFAVADDLQALPRRLAEPGIDPRGEAERLLERARLVSAQGEAAVLALLLAVPVLAGPALTLAARTNTVRSGALACALSAITPPVVGASPAASTPPRAAAAAAAALAALVAAAPAEAAAAARAMDQACQASLAQSGLALARQARAAASDGAIIAIEAAARDLRCLATTAARLGTAAEYDRIMRQIAGAADLLPRADGARLTEILLGTEAALTRLRSPR